MPPTATLAGPPTLATFRFAASLDPRRRALHSRRLMLDLSYVIEDIAASVPGTAVIAAFQRLSFARSQLARYAQFAPQLARAYLIGLPDHALPELPNTTVVPIEPDWPLVHEWVVLATGPACCVGLFAEDRDASQPALRSRQFAGSWTTDQPVLDAARAAFYSALGQPCPPLAYDDRAVYETTRRVQHALSERMRASG